MAHVFHRLLVAMDSSIATKELLPGGSARATPSCKVFYYPRFTLLSHTWLRKLAPLFNGFLSITPELTL